MLIVLAFNMTNLLMSQRFKIFELVFTYILHPIWKFLCLNASLPHFRFRVSNAS